LELLEKKIITEEIELLKELQLLNYLKLLTNQTTQKILKKEKLMCECSPEGEGVVLLLLVVVP